MLLTLFASSALASPSCPGLEDELLALDNALHCPTVQLNALGERAVALGQEECVQQALIARSLPSGLPTVLPELPPAPPFAKAERDVYNASNSVTSENFAIRWNSGNYTSKATQMLEAFETAWAMQIDEMDYPSPYGADSYLFNVYIGDTGGSIPGSYGAAGYYYYDSQGWPIIVLAPGTLDDYGYGKLTAVHEFFHAVQGAVDTYQYSGAGAWYYEATASQIEVEAYPNDPDYAVFLFGYSMFPHLPVNFFDYPDTGALEEYHQYGAFIFIQYMAEFHGGWPIIQESWLDPQGTDDPLVALDRLLQRDSGVSIQQGFGDFAAHNATWDYDDGDVYEQAHNAYADYYSAYDNRVAARVDGAIDWTAGPADIQPQRFGTNNIELIPDASGPDLNLRFEGESGDKVDWDLRVVTVTGGQAEYWILEGDGASFDDWVPGAGSADEIWLVVNANTASWVDGEDFGYEYAVAYGEAELQDTGTPLITDEDLEALFAACGCASGRPVGGTGVLLAALGLLMVRRRD